MAGINFNELDQVEAQSSDKINFLKLQDDGWYAKVRFMYGAGESFQAQTVHNISDNPTRPRFVPCLRQLGQPVDVCPLCEAGSKVAVQFFIPLYVISIVSNVRGVEQEQPVNQVMFFQKGITIKGVLQSVIRQTVNTHKPIVSSVFNLVRNGKASEKSTSYSVEYVSTDDVTLDQLPPIPAVLGSYILPDIDYKTMKEKYVDKTSSTMSDIQARTVSASVPNVPPLSETPVSNLSSNQLSPEPPTISSSRVAF